MKKTLCILLLAVLCLSFAACGAQKSLYDYGMDIIEVIDEKGSNRDYLYATIGSPTIVDGAIERMNNTDDSTPVAVYELVIDTDRLISEIANFNISDMSPALKRSIEITAINSIALRLNSSAGSEAVAISSVLSYGKSFVCGGLKNDTVYIYEFENGYPVFVTFIKGDDNIMSVNGNVVFVDNLDLDHFSNDYTSIKKIK
jgi:hypothetical protein